LGYMRIEKQNALESIKGAVSNLNHYKHALIGSLFSVLGTGLLWVSFANTLASIASPITATSGVIVVLLAVVFMDERITLKSIIAMMLVFIGVMGISISSEG